MLRSSWQTSVIAAIIVAAAAVIGGCGQFSPAYMKPLNKQSRAMLLGKGMTEESAILIRVFKAESELEVWKEREDGRFYHFKSYPICSYSGGLGPKIEEGDRQAPEGFYLVSMDQMNPKSQYHLAFNVGFPNAFDRSHGRTGKFIMIHGDCTSRGCYAMTDGVMEEIYILAREALSGGQTNFQIHAFPFRMTAANMAAHEKHEWYDFWKNLKEGYDYFEVTRQAPRIAVCERRYLINAVYDDTARFSASGTCPTHQKGQIAAFTPLPTPKSTQSASLTKPLGSVLGLRFGPSKANYSAFTLGPATPEASGKKR
ncbi:MAG: murein L,D-transpeptidase [Alphaproteobacteria bacterium]|nr:murein L,D-transpeptidase [Alphaproteobacteria bacterium]